MKKRIVLLLSVVALMVVMLATSVAPAFAVKQWICVPPRGVEEEPVQTADKDLKNGLEDAGWVCTKFKIKRVPG
jgi:hypothetical protein